MPTPFGARRYFDLGLKCDEADLADNDVVISGVTVPFAGTVAEVWVGCSVLPKTGTLAVAKLAGDTATKLLSATTVNLASDLVAGVGEACTLSVPVALRIAAGNMLRATWTLTDITVTDDAVFTCIVGVDPDGW